MLHDILVKMKSTFVSPEEVAAFETTLPNKLHISYKKDRDMYIGFIDEIDGQKIKGKLITQAKTYSELINNINQLAYTYINMPEKIRPYYGNRFYPPANTPQSAKGSLTLQKA